jgi:ubiquinone/menaquinone biosynthesis C-methylase UbiE
VNRGVIDHAFTALASTYEETVDREVRELCGLGYRELLASLARAVPVAEGQLVLDVASGTAVSSVEVARQIGTSSKVVGLDITRAMTEYGIDNIRRANLSAQVSQVCGSGMRMPLAAHSFDSVICCLGTHHMDVEQLLSEVKRVMRRGGDLIMADVGAPAFWRSSWGRIVIPIILAGFRLFWRSARAQAEAEAVASFHTADEWRALLAGFGFSQIEVAEWPPRRFWYPCALIMKAVCEVPP